MIVVHVTREIAHLWVSGANGNGRGIVEAIKGDQGLMEDIHGLPYEEDYLGPGELKDKIRRILELRKVIPKGEKWEVWVY